MLKVMMPAVSFICVKMCMKRCYIKLVQALVYEKLSLNDEKLSLNDESDSPNSYVILFIFSVYVGGGVWNFNGM